MSDVTSTRPSGGAQSETKGDRTRRSILDAATDRFARQGYRAASVTDIARDAGVGGTTAYVHFANKEALFLAAVDDDLSGLFANVVEVLAREPRGSLLAELLSLVDEHPLARRLLAGQEPEITARVLDVDAFGALRATVAAGLSQARDEGRARGDVDPAVLADGLVAVVVSVLMGAVQIGDHVLEVYGPAIEAVLAAATSPSPPAG